MNKSERRIPTALRLALSEIKWKGSKLACVLLILSALCYLLFAVMSAMGETDADARARLISAVLSTGVSATCVLTVITLAKLFFSKSVFIDLCRTRQRVLTVEYLSIYAYIACILIETLQNEICIHSVFGALCGFLLSGMLTLVLMSGEMGKKVKTVVKVFCALFVLSAIPVVAETLLGAFSAYTVGSHELNTQYVLALMLPFGAVNFRVARLLTATYQPRTELHLFDDASVRAAGIDMTSEVEGAVYETECD